MKTTALSSGNKKGWLGMTMTPPNITLRLAAAFCLLAAVLFVVGWQGISRLRQLDAQMQNIVYQQWTEEQLANQALQLSDANSRITLLFFLVDDQDEIKSMLDQRAANTQRISGLISALEPMLEPGRETAMFAAVKTTRTPYLEDSQQALSLLLVEHKPDEARKVMVDDVRPKLIAYHNAWNTFVQHQVDQINQIEQQNKADFATGQRNFLLLLILAGLITGVIAIYSVMRLNREIAVGHRARRSLQQAHDALEVRVTGRTAELATINKALRVENAERKRVEETLRESEERFSGAFEYAPIGVALVLPDGHWLKVNRALCSLVGYSEAELLTRTFQDITCPGDLNMDLEYAHRLLAGKIHSYQIEKRYVHARGHLVTVLLNVSLVRDGLGQPLYFISQIQDITDRKRLEGRLFQSQKMETVGKLAGGFAHEFNSILTAIIGQSELLLVDLPTESPLAKNAMEINKAAGRAATLTRQLLAYGRKQILQPEVLDLNSVLTGMESTLRHLMGHNSDIRIVPAAGLKAVKADAGQIEQVVLNIVMNAADAMPNGGKLTLETANVSFDEDSVERFPELKPGDYVMLAITDTGPGMTEEIKARVFEPFFSTKDVGQGAGLGLSTCYGIVKQSGGHISVYSEPGRGTTFKIYLPQLELPPKTFIQRPDAPDLPRGTETILLVEDDPALREMAATLLRRLGYTVLAAANGIEALNLKQQRNIGHVDLLFTDVVMPHMNGKELADRLLAFNPHTKILFTSAYTENAIVHQGVLDKGVALLQKPFTPSALAHKLREILDQPGTQKAPGFAETTDGNTPP
jgi:two-component system, cell cycle sensor histidine kinase and response regulator CckA